MKFISFLLLIFIQAAFIFSQINYEKHHLENHFVLSKYNKQAYPGDPSFDVVYYKLNLKINYFPKYLNGEVTLDAKSKVDNLDSIFLDLNNILTVDSVISNSKSLSYVQEELILKILLNRSYNFDEHLSIKIYYQGVPQSSGLGSFAFDSHDNEPSIWTLSEPYGSRDWWPCKDTPADKADSADIWITCPSNLIGVSNGKLIDETDNGDGTKTYKWKNSYPIANYLISLAISNYTVDKNYFKYLPAGKAGSDKDSMLVIHYVYPEQFISVKPLLDETVNALEIFSSLFGEYPFLKEKYGHAQFGRGGMEHQTITSIGIFTDDVLVHELAHQWFGDKITCKDWQNIWLNEGFATYSEGLYTESKKGRDEYNSFISEQMLNAKQAIGSIYVQNINSITEIFNGARSYSKGAVVLHMLRGVVGDSIFFRILKNYLSDNTLAYGNAVTEDFQIVAENVYGKPLDYFFSEWIYGENYPKYFVEWNYEKAGSQDESRFNIRVRINQSENSFPRFFTMPVQIKITTAIKDTLLTLFNNIQDQSFNFLIDGEPISLLFDPDNLIMKDVILDDPDKFLSSFILKQNYPNPFNSSTKIEYRIPRRSQVKMKIFDMLGNEVDRLLNEEKDAGSHTVIFEANSLSSGVYFYRLEAEDESGLNQVFIETKKFILIK